MLRWAKKVINRNRRSRRAISVIMANLTMLVIVVSLSAMLFIWATTSFSIYQGGAGYFFASRGLANQERPVVEATFFSGSPSNNIVTIYVRNVGAIPFNVASVYINGTLYQQCSSSCPPATLVSVNQVGSFTITLTSPQKWGTGNLQSVEIATLRGTTQTTTWVP